MSDVPRSAPKPTAFELKSAQLPLVALLVKTADVAVLSAQWEAQYGSTPDFFDQEPLVVDLTPISSQADVVPDFKAIIRLLHRHRVCAIAVKGGSEAQMQAAVAAGLVAAPDAVVVQAKTPAERVPVAPVAPSPAASLPPVIPPPSAPQFLPPLVVDKPLRSGQQVYAKGRDLVVLSIVNAGAEVIADGDIHVYATLRGKAMAGARGNEQARIFTLSMDAELVSIAGIYRNRETPLPTEVKGHPTMVTLHSGPDGDKLLLTPIRP